MGQAGEGGCEGLLPQLNFTNLAKKRGPGLVLSHTA